MEKKRKYIVITVLVGMVAVAGYLNMNYNPENKELSETVSSDNPGEAAMVNADVAVNADNEKKAVVEDSLKEARDTKNTSRSKAMEMLNTIINDAATDKESKEKASAELVSMADNMEAEGVIEGVLKTKGYPENVVFITNGMASVSVKTDKNLTAADVAKIQDVVKSNSKVQGDKITITQVK